MTTIPSENKEFLKHIVERARSLRGTSTKPENLLWFFLRNSSFAGLKFRRQHPVGPYVTDFCCLHAKLVIEIDGESHDFAEQQDAERTRFLNQQGFRVLRVTNNDVLENIEGVLLCIGKELGADWEEVLKKSTWKKRHTSPSP